MTVLENVSHVHVGGVNYENKWGKVKGAEVSAPFTFDSGPTRNRTSDVGFGIRSYTI